MATMGGTKRARGGATALDVMQSSRKLRCVLLACAAMTQYLLAREEMLEDMRTPMIVGEAEAAADEHDLAVGYAHSLLMMQWALLLSAARPLAKKGLRRRSC